MPRQLYSVVFILMLSCAGGPHKALWECVEMDQDSSTSVNDSVARVAYNYYSRHGSLRNRMMATYYLGQAEFDAGQNIPATIRFKQAYDLAIRLRDTTYLGFSCLRLSELYSRNLDNERYAYYAAQAIPLLDHIGDSLTANYTRLQIAGYHMSQGRFERAKSIIDSLRNSNPAYWSKDYYASVIKGNLHFFQKEYDSARFYYNRVIGMSPSEPIYFGRLALIAEHQGKRQLSDSLLHLSQAGLSSSNDSINYFANKSEIAALRKDFETAFRIQSLEYGMQDTIVYHTLARSVTHSMQTYFEQEYEEEKAKRRDLNIIFLLSSIILLGIVIIALIALKRRKEQVVVHMTQMEALEQELQQMRQGKEGAHAVISKLVQDRIKTMSQLADVYLSWSDEAVILREVQQGRTFKEDIVSEFRKELRKLRDDEHFIPGIESALNNSHNGIMTRIRKDCHGLRNGDIRVNERDFQLLNLFFAGFSNTSVAFMLDMTDDAVRSRKKNLRKVFLSMENGCGNEYLSMLSRAQHTSDTSAL